MRKSWLLAAIGLAAFAVLVWLAGPHLILGGQAPLSSPWARTLLAGLFILQYLAHKLWTLGQARRRHERVLDGLAVTAQTNPGSAPEHAQLQERFTAALAQLRHTRFGSRSGRSSRSWQFGRSYLYQLPWYVIIGAPGTGKTTALLNSGLEFPLSAQLGRGPVAGVGGTRHCDWWFTDSAVLIDTAGRYTTQDSDHRADAAGWRAFLELLRQARPRRPLNGVLIAVSVGDLLGFDAAQLAAHAHMLRHRFDELQSALAVRLPAYLLVTKCDLLPGFVDWFAAADRAQRDAVWGVTFDLPTAHAGQSAARFAPAFADLVSRLADGLAARLDDERDPQRRARLFALPSQVRALSVTLGALVRAAFDSAPSAADAPAPLLRGVYLTSGTQEGTPIDRLLSALGRELGLQQHILPPNQSLGKSFFVSRLLTDVVFAEGHLSGRAPLRQRWQGRLLLAAGAAVQLAALGIALVWLAAYRGSLAEIARSDAAVAHLETSVAALPARIDSDPRALLPALDALRVLALEPEPIARHSKLMDLGLAARRKLHAGAQAAYDRMLLGPLQTSLAAAVDATLRNGADMTVQYEALKTYVMLTDAAHFDASALQLFVLAYWDSALAPALSPQERARLTLHVDALLAAGAFGSGLRWDSALVESVRTRLQSQSAAQRIALRLNGLLQQHPYADVSQASLAPATGLWVATGDTTPSGAVAGRYTLDAYRDLVLPQATRIAAQLSAEAPWVLGAAPTHSATTAEDYLDAYRREYTQAWTQLVGSLQFKPMATEPAARQQLQALAQPHGGLAQLLQAIVRQTPTQLADAAPGPLSATDPAGAALAALAGLVTADGALAEPLARALRELQDLRSSSPPPPGADARLARVIDDARQQPPPVRALLQAFAVLPPSGAIRGGTPAAVSQQIAARLGAPCWRLVAGNFPFDRRAPRDASLQDFARLFAANGRFAAAFAQLPKANVDARDLERFHAAARIRAAFFPGDAAQPRLQLTFRPLDMDQQIDRFHLDIDGQSVDYAHGPVRATIVTWPGPQGRAQVTVTPAAGAQQAYDGPWAIFRLLDHAAVQETDTPGRFNVIFDVGGRHASFQVDSDSGSNPFRLRELEHLDCPVSNP